MWGVKNTECSAMYKESWLDCSYVSQQFYLGHVIKEPPNYCQSYLIIQIWIYHLVRKATKKLQWQQEVVFFTNREVLITGIVHQPVIQQLPSLDPRLSPLWCQLGFLTHHARKPQGLGALLASENLTHVQRQGHAMWSKSVWANTQSYGKKHIKKFA